MYNQTNISGYLNVLLELLTSPVGMGAIGAYLLLLVFVASVSWGKWCVLSLLLFVSTMGDGSEPWFDHILLPPFEQIRANGRIIAVALLAALAIPAILAPRGYRVRLLPGFLLLFFFFQVCFLVRLGLGGMGARAVLGIITLGGFLTLVWGMGKWLQGLADVDTAMRSFASGGVLIVAATLLHVVLTPDRVIWSNRLFGITSNPQHAAALFAILSLLFISMAFSPREYKLVRVVWWTCAVLSILFLVWTGSRTGLLMAIVGFAMFFRRNVRLAMAAVVLGGFALVIAMILLPGSTEIADRLLSTTDTRATIIEATMEQFFASPLYGTVTPDSVITYSSSYLSIAARMGLIGIVMFAAVAVSVLLGMWRLSRLSNSLGNYRLLADFVLAGVSAIAIGSMTEGLLLGVLTFPVITLYFLSSVWTALMETPRFVAPYYEQVAASTGYPVGA